jgi:hypothetical protein
MGMDRTPLKEGRLVVGKRTHQVDFLLQSSFMDPDVSDACVVVLTSNGNRGTISHLTICDNPGDFANDLRDFLGETGTPVCLSGGLVDVLASVRLVDRLFATLKATEFNVSRLPQHCDVLGRFSRQATLFADKVVVTRRPYGDRMTYTPRELKFPNATY